MDYNETLEYIHSLNRFGIKPGLERIASLMDYLENPQESLKFIHVAGTNGKGSTSTMLSNIMIESGKKTGLFISPFVVDFRERIQVNGEYIEKKALCDLTQRVRIAAEKVANDLKDSVTEFEFITAVAFLYFAQCKCDIVVLETGLGGRLDSTNIIKRPLASVITKIALDHVGVLGDTIEKIALEKCGIIKEDSVVVTASTQDATALNVIKLSAEEKGAKLFVADAKEMAAANPTAFGTDIIYKGKRYFTKLAGLHQTENMVTAIETALSLEVSEEIIEKGIAKTIFPARLEVISKKPLVILDGAHNDNGADALSKYLDMNNIRPVMVLGMMGDKNCASVVNKLCQRAAAVVTVTVSSNSRTESAEHLATMAKEYCENVSACSGYEEALEIAQNKMEELSAPLVVCGSLYLASDIRPALIKKYQN